MSMHGTRTPLEITSVSNPRVKWLVDLRKRRTRESEGVALVEGFAELSLALESGVTPLQLFCCPGLVRDVDELRSLTERLARLGAEVVTLSEAPFRKASYREAPDGWLAVVRDPSRPLGDLELSDSPLVLVCEAVEKPGNLGAMLRTAEAVGVDAVISASAVADWGNPNVVRASKGTVFGVPVSTASTGDVIVWLRRQRLRVVVATPGTASVVSDLDLRGRLAVVVGAEHEGLSGRWLTAADDTASLPMFGRVNSLNVATSAAVVLYEAVRQRGLVG